MSPLDVPPGAEPYLYGQNTNKSIRNEGLHKKIASRYAARGGSSHLLATLLTLINYKPLILS